MASKLESSALSRKERLAQLKNLKRKQDETEETPDDNAGTSEEAVKDVTHSIGSVKLSGRNYDPETKAPKMGYVSAPTEGQETLEDQAARLAEEVRKKNEEEEKEAEKGKQFDLFTLQPKRPNWDLKRDVEVKLERLRPKTDAAIAKLIRERLKKKKEEAEKKGQKEGEGEGEDMGVVEGNLAELVKEREREQEEEREREKDES
ncbi:hypothetical protein BJ508DRAFT_415730 [Ascobolus immersus RN42]|uniref:Cwf18 pre-mRNA splicing factor n=1 Tax=Ascobolus immersus RN42 TaxID=1160509 RepID=A0A3N4I2V4_ASCIM|nr:hypothetical protein BJ508DRAFT_415730 [Ascobolus immersus RN42]